MSCAQLQAPSLVICDVAQPLGRDLRCGTAALGCDLQCGTAALGCVPPKAEIQPSISTFGRTQPRTAVPQYTRPRAACAA